MPLHFVSGSNDGQRAALVAALLDDAIDPVHATWGATTPSSAWDLAEDRGSLRPLEGGLRVLLVGLDLPGPVIADLVAGALPEDLTAMAALAAGLRTMGERTIVVEIPARCDPGSVIALPARAARALDALIPVVARWGVLIGPTGVGTLPRPGMDVFDALRQVAAELRDLDALLCDPKTGIHHVPGVGPAAAAASAGLDVTLALMGRERTRRASDGHRGTTGARVVREGDHWRYEIELPGLHAQDVELRRHHDELVIASAGRRRTHLLPSVLRRCVVTRAGMREGVLTLDLVPDEAVWPR